MTMIDEPIIVLENVKKHYVRGKTIVRALDGINLQINRGTFTAVTGPSGSGKTTLLKVIGLITDKSEGKLQLMGLDVENLKESKKCSFRSEIGFVFQDFKLLPAFTALENVTFALAARGIKKKERNEIGINVLKKMGLGDRLNHKPNELSGGEQQRVSIARAVIVNPIIILADEPTGNLDKKTGRDILDLFHNLNKDDGHTILFVTHNNDISDEIGNIIEIVDGKIVTRDF